MGLGIGIQDETFSRLSGLLYLRVSCGCTHVGLSSKAARMDMAEVRVEAVYSAVKLLTRFGIECPVDEGGRHIVKSPGGLAGVAMSQLDLHAPVLEAILGLEDLRFISLTSSDIIAGNAGEESWPWHQLVRSQA